MLLNHRKKITTLKFPPFERLNTRCSVDHWKRVWLHVCLRHSRHTPPFRCAILKCNACPKALFVPTGFHHEAKFADHVSQTAHKHVVFLPTSGAQQLKTTVTLRTRCCSSVAKFEKITVRMFLASVTFTRKSCSPLLAPFHSIFDISNFVVIISSSESSKLGRALKYRTAHNLFTVSQGSNCRKRQRWFQARILTYQQLKPGYFLLSIWDRLPETERKEINHFVEHDSASKHTTGWYSYFH